MLARQHHFRQRRAGAVPAVDDAGFDLAVGAFDLGGDRTELGCGFVLMYTT